MNLARHCTLCEHQEMDLHKGSICGLTRRKPAFHKTCSKIELREKFENTIFEVNIKCQELKKLNNINIFYFLLFFTLGLVVIGSGILHYGIYSLGYYYPSAQPYLDVAAGIITLVASASPLIQNLLKLRQASYEKEKLDKLLALYNISFDISIKFEKNNHGLEETYIDLKTKGVR